MILSELFRRLAVGELSNLALVGDLDDNDIRTVREEQQPKIVTYINDGLLKLYGKFMLKESDLVLQTTAGLTQYPLRLAYALTRDDPADTRPAFIQDSVAAPFLGDVIKILEVFDGCQVPLNDPDDCRSLFTPQPDVLQVPTPIDGQLISVLYQARHPALTGDDLAVEIELPAVLETALQSWVAHKTFFHMNTQESQASAQLHLATYESICLEVVENGLVSSDPMLASNRFTKRGWR